ncbi:MAG: hypothetical protein ABR599_12875 [Gemmatimonadota bacterium]
MGKQYNKVEKAQRRSRRNKRKKEQAAEAALRAGRPRRIVARTSAGRTRPRSESPAGS